MPGVVSVNYVTAVSHQPRGSWPLHFGKDYPEDIAHMKIYAEASRTQEGFDRYLEEYVFEKELA